jgi:flagellar motor protein MotB
VNGAGWARGWGGAAKGGGRHAEDESYFVSVSDLMVGLLFLFIIILMAFALNFRSAEDAAEETLDALTKERNVLELERDALESDQAALTLERDRLLADRDRLAGIIGQLLARDALRAELLTLIRQALAARGLEVEVDVENGILRLPESLLFATNEAELSETGRAAIGVLAEVLWRYLPCYAAMAEAEGCPTGVHDVLETVLIEGHTDDRPIRSGPFPDNWALSAARSRSTYRAMIAAEPRLDDLRNGSAAALLGVSGYEARRPVADGATDEARRVNRRIDVRFLSRGPDAAALAELLETLETSFVPR